MNPLVSIIVPVYNVEEYLDECVESLVNQTYPDIEIILVDDGSPDNCPKMCDDWAKRDSRIKVIHKENGGAASARNIGFDNATGEYIGFVDTFGTPYTGEKKYVGMKFTVLSRVKELTVDKDGADLECLPMWNIQFENGDKIAAYPEEICLAER